MRNSSRPFFVVLVSLFSFLPNQVIFAQPSVWTYHNDNSRTGANTNETILTPSTVNTNSFGKLFTYGVDGYIYTQPLYIPNVTITGKGVHNVVYVGTEGDTVYAFDADSNAGGNAVPLWQKNLLGTGETTVGTNDVGTTDVMPQIGITGTPVIDVASGTLYLVAKSKSVTGGVTNFIQRLHALDITSGNERSNSPVDIQATVPGSGEGSTNGSTVDFDLKRQHQRSGLLLLNNVVYIVWASHGDLSPYHGWIMGYDKTTLARISVFNTSPNGWKTGIWQGGNGPAADTNGNMFFMTGNGSYDGPTNNDFGDSFVKLNTTNANTNLIFTDWFTPYNQLTMGGTSNADSDLGSGGPLLLPDAVGSVGHKHLVVGAGKLGTIYMVDRDNMGHYNEGGTNDSQIVQYITNALAIPNMSTPTYWNYRLYYLAHRDLVKAFSISNAVLSALPVDKSATTPNSWFGNTMSISANGNSNGVLWIIDAYKGTVSNTVLHAFNAANLTTELYNSGMAGTRDTGPAGVKFTVPTVVNGKVYIGGQSSLAVYGYGAFTAAPIIVSQPQTQSVAAGANVTLNVGALSSNAFSVYWFFDGTNIPGATSTNLVLNNVQPGNAGYYTVTLSNSFGATASGKAYLSVVPPLTNNPGAVLAPTGLVNWWPADGNGIDIFGGNNATPVNNMTYTSGESGMAFQFDGTNSYMNVGAANLTSPWTVCMWVKRESSPSNSTILLGDTTYYVKLEQYNTTYEAGFTQLGVKDYPFNYITPSNTWSHLAFVGTSASVSVYGNGVLKDSTNVSNFPLPRTYIGTGVASAKFIDFAHCALDEIMVFNRALSGSEISSIYNAGSAGLVRAPQFSGIVQTNGQLVLSLKGQTGKTFTLQSSTDLVTWNPVTTLANPTGTNTYSEAVTNAGAKFYKLSQP